MLDHTCIFAFQIITTAVMTARKESICMLITSQRSRSTPYSSRRPTAVFFCVCYTQFKYDPMAASDPIFVIGNLAQSGGYTHFMEPSLKIKPIEYLATIQWPLVVSNPIRSMDVDVEIRCGQTSNRVRIEAMQFILFMLSTHLHTIHHSAAFPGVCCTYPSGYVGVIDVDLAQRTHKMKTLAFSDEKIICDV